MSKDLHIITLNIPYPADYGGMIDSYFRLRAMNMIGTRVHLHCFEYGRSHSDELGKLCASINYYRRETGFHTSLSKYPYIVKSRSSGNLLKDLVNDNFPILFDGLHTCYYLGHSALAERKKFVRAHNVEHHYYNNLARAEKNPLRKSYYVIEALRLKSYERLLEKADTLFAISRTDHEYFNNRYSNSELILPFHPFDHLISEPGYGSYLLYHGDLSVSENNTVARFLTGEVFSKIQYPCIIAGRNPSRHLFKEASRYKNISLITDPDDDRMSELIRKAHINILPALSAGGFRLKLLAALYSGRHCLVNKHITEGTGLDDYCTIAGTEREFIEKANLLITQPFTEEMKKYREKVLMKDFDNKKNAEKLADLIFS